MRATIAICAVLTCLAAPATVQPAATVDFKGTATVGPLTRAVSLSVSCTMSGKRVETLSLSLELKDISDVKRFFDIDVLEGPYGKAVAGNLVASGASGTSTLNFSPNGSYSAGAGFQFDGGFLSPPRMPAKKLKEAQSLLITLAKEPSQLP